MTNCCVPNQCTHMSFDYLILAIGKLKGSHILQTDRKRQKEKKRKENDPHQMIT